jgi:hypothetical protein
MSLKVFIQFSSVFSAKSITFEGQEYKEEEFSLLHQKTFPVYEKFDKTKKRVTVGRFQWLEETGYLYMHMWLKPEEVNYFEYEIITGQLVPMNIKIVTDNVSDDTIKEYF